MKIFVSRSSDPYLNFAREEVILKDKSFNGEDIVMLYKDVPSVIVGRNQNILEEVNIDFINKEKIILARRVSGGGAVYHDDGNINFSFTTSRKPGSYEKFLEPIIEFLNSIGIKTKFKGKNDLIAEGYKISGNAQYVFGDRMLHHGTLLFDVDLSILSKALKPNKLKLESKGIKSVRQRVINIKELIDYDMNSDEFLEALTLFFVSRGATEEKFENYKVNDIKALQNVRKSKDWNFGKNPQFDVLNEKKFDGGIVKVKIHTKQNKIISIKFEGDFLSRTNLTDLEKKFIGVEFEKESINKKINSIELFMDYFGKVTKEEISSLILGVSNEN